MEEIRVGLVRGRHPLPVNEYIFNEELTFPLDYKKLDETVRDFINEKVGVGLARGMGIDREPDYGELVCDLIREGLKKITVYVTGLTPCTASLIKVCARNGVALTLMHYDPTSGEYSTQVIF
jgi:hypothetical protein